MKSPILLDEKKMHATDRESREEFRLARGDFHRTKTDRDTHPTNKSEAVNREPMGILKRRILMPFPIFVNGRSRSRSRSCEKLTPCPKKLGIMRMAVAIKAKKEIANHIREVRERIKCLREQRL